MIGCKLICFFGEVPPRQERTKKKPYAGGNRAGTACGQTDAEEEPGSWQRGLHKSCLSGCSAQECRERSSLRGSRAAALPSGCDALRHILLGIIWRIAGGRFAAPLHRVAPTPRTASSAYPQKGEMVAETDPTQWPRRKARHL